MGKKKDLEKPSRISPEARERLSQLAKQRHREGKFGGSKYGKLGGRPRKTDKERAASSVADAAQEEENRKKIIQVFKDAVDDGQAIGVRLKAAQAWLEVEREEEKLSLQERSQEEEQLSREELLSILSRKLTSGPAASALRRQLLEEENIPEAEVVEDDDEREE